MNVLLDARDLINLMERARPVTAEEIERYLRDHNHEFVLSFTNIRELVSTLNFNDDFMRVRPWLQALDRMPHLYIQEVMIPRSEIECAVTAFNGDRIYRMPEMFVRRWDGTLMTYQGQRAEIEQIVGIRLDDLVYWIYSRRPEIFAPPERYLPTLQRQFEEDRRAWRAGEAPTKTHFIRIITKHSATRGIQLPFGREDEFVEWIYESPDRCPGLHLHLEVYRALMENVNDIPEAADFSDLAHVYAIPYVQSATLDRRMRHYCRIASERLLDRGGLVNYGERLYESLAMFLGRNS